MVSISILLLALLFATAGCILWHAGRYLLQQYYWSSLRFVPGPPSPGFIHGNLSEVFAGDRPAVHHAWVAKYGHVLKYRGMFNMEQIVGRGMLFSEDEQHRRQRRIMNPAFGPGQIRDLTDVFIEKAIELRDIWSSHLPDCSGHARINIFDDLTRTTLDIIGLAGFEYYFDALHESNKTSAELRAAFKTIYSIDPSSAIMRALQLSFPLLYLVPHQGLKRLDKARKVMESAFLSGKMMYSTETSSRCSSKRIWRSIFQRTQDSRMKRSFPLMWDSPAEIPTLLVAGHETTSIAASWCLYSLAQNPEMQHKLRKELLNVATDDPTMDELNTLPYLDAVVRETLRFHSPVPFTLREATKNDVIPLNTPYTDIRGQVHDSIKIDKGTTVLVPIAALNLSKDLWGRDAAEFRPERWESLPEAVSSMPGVWGNMSPSSAGRVRASATVSLSWN
ncbi:cytochrome P450 [Obba rivulosa]|uniref:Cytochrome P450 n=1 Tax=Obba rivulosa TaxID=1052685 RepID=A0A8E2DGK7_9APHY|nr:cytochrome P450 [Obba rivulosa]